MPDIPADAQRSEDGNYWWDGNQWQLVDQSQAGGQSQADGSQGGADDQQSVAMTDDHFANMLAAAEQDVAEG
ncbi:MAG: hypothetical protein AUG49_02840 [Catenulispora sp. 13_1_20CM_3_70_7]|nr:MAG: hypothetical protein AUG49_02840 [Catenulispora sp. 13_1_20CM_3_70_7]